MQFDVFKKRNRRRIAFNMFLLRCNLPIFKILYSMNINMKNTFNSSFFRQRRLFYIFLTVIFISPAVFAQDNYLENVMTEVSAYITRRDYNSALALFDSLPRDQAESLEIRILRATILNAAGRPAEAIIIANGITAVSANNTDALMILADAAALQNRDRDRRTFLERIIGIDAQHARALNDLANINLRNQNLRVAANYFERVLAFDPNNGDALVGRASVYRYNSDPRNAELLLNRAAALYPNWAAPLQERARLYRSYGFHSDALEDFGAALALEPDNYWVLVDYAQTLFDVGRMEEALVRLERAIIISPNDFIAYVYSAAIKDELGDYAGAERDYLSLIRCKPDYYFAYEALGVIRMRNKQWTGARDAFLEAYRYAPSEFGYAILAAINWMRAGRQTDPRQFLAQVIRAAPRDSLDLAMLRLYHDLSGDQSVTILVENERNLYTKSRMLYYLAAYHDIRGSRMTADRYYLMVRDLGAVGSLEYRINEIFLIERGLNLRITP